MQEKSALERELENIYIYIYMYILPTSHLCENFINIAYIYAFTIIILRLHLFDKKYSKNLNSITI